MKTLWLIGMVLIFVPALLLMRLHKAHTTEGDILSHHTEKGFRNPYPGFKKRGFSDFLKWVVFERGKDNEDRGNAEYFIETVKNDGSFLRANNSDFTVTWVGHSTVLVQLEGLNIVTDPMWSDRASPVTWAGPKRFVEPGLAFENLPEIDVILITHDHYDHLDKPTIQRLGNEPFYLVPLGIGKFLRKLGIDNYRELDWWNAVLHKGIEFTCTPAQHFSGRGLFDRNATLWCGWVVRGKSGSLYFAGDTGYFPGLKEIGERYSPFDLVCLPIGAYLPQWFMGPVHLSPREAIQVYKELRGRVFLAIHWGTFKLASDPINLSPNALLEEIQRCKLEKEDFWLLKHGETRNVTQFLSSPIVKKEEASLQ